MGVPDPGNRCTCDARRGTCGIGSVHCNGGSPWRRVTFTAPRFVGWLLRWWQG